MLTYFGLAIFLTTNVNLLRIGYFSYHQCYLTLEWLFFLPLILTYFGLATFVMYIKLDLTVLRVWRI